MKTSNYFLKKSIRIFGLLFLFSLFPFASFSQTGTSFYLRAYNKADLTPVNKIKNGKYFELTFANPDLNLIFDDLEVLDYEQTFEGLSLCANLDNVFSLELEEAVSIKIFQLSSLIENVEIIPEYELTSGDLPNDYFIPTFDEANQYESPGDFIRNDYLDLIQAPCAWELTKGDPNIIVGISDTYFSEVHEELEGKFEMILSNGPPSGEVDLRFKHGIETASLIAGNSNNNKGTASIGYNTRLVGRYPHGSESLEDLVQWSIENNNKMKVINMSYGYLTNDPITYMQNNSTEKELYECLSNNYNIVLVASGNNKIPEDLNEPNNWFSFPASYENVISVTTVGSRYPYEDFDFTVHNPERTNLKDVLFWDGGMYLNKHRNHHILNDNLDIAAPSYDIFRPTNTRTTLSEEDSVDAYAKTNGATSTSAPLVSGTVALMFAVNPNLTAVEVKDILKYTADRIDTIPHNQEYFGSGPDKLSIQLGRLNAYKAVKMAKYFDDYGYDFESMPRKVDLMIRDNEEDIGEEPNETTEMFWNSPDIWVRNQPDGIEEHENALYNFGTPSYVYVRIKNKGCEPTSGKDKVKLYWTKAASSMNWDEDYLGEKYYGNSNAKQGDTINTVKIPSLKPGEETILEIPWTNVPDHRDYEHINATPWHFCLLARIESDDDPMTYAETSSIHDNDRFNNNIASKNLTVLNFDPINIGQDLGGAFGFQNPNITTTSFDLELTPDDNETGKVISNEAEVRIILDETLKNAWEAGGKQSSNLVHLRDSIFLVTGENAKLKNIVLGPREYGIVNIDFHFLTREITEKSTYLYHAIQRKSSSNEILGGESYQINKSARPLFFANTHETPIVDKGEQIVLEAVSIGEPALYNWYDNDGHQIFEGIDFSASAEVGKLYKLEVISLADGYKDYAQVQINYKPNRITSLSPNPAEQEVFVEYKINEGESAYLALTSIDNPNQSHNYILNIEETGQTIDLNNLPVGMYSVALIVNGQIADSKNLIKE